MSGFEYICLTKGCSFLGVGKYEKDPGKCPECGGQLVLGGWDEWHELVDTPEL